MGYIPAQNARKVFTTVLANVFQDFIEAPSFLSSFAKRKAYKTKTVQSLARRGTEKIAVDVIRGSKGNLNQMTRFTQKEFLPPYYKEKINVSAMNIYDIPFSSGDSYNTAQIDALAQETAQALSETKKMVDRAIELQHAQMLETGIVELKNGDNIDYKRKSEMIEVLTGTELWDSADADIIKFFEDKGLKLRTVGKVSGGQSVDCVMGAEAWQAFRANKDIKDGENFYTQTVLSLNPARVNAAGGAYRGTLKAGIYSFDIWTYDEFYDHPTTSVSTRYLNTKIVHLIPRSFVAETSFCQVPELPSWVRRNPRSNRVFNGLEQSMMGFRLFDYVHEEDEVYYAGIKAAPLAQLVSVDRLYTAQVISTAQGG